MLIKKRFPSERELGRRFTYMIFTFLLMSGLFLLLLFQGYEDIDFFNYRFDDDSFVWAYFGLGIGNIFLTFLHEGIARYENWKANLQETEQLKKVNRQSSLHRLKSQVVSGAALHNLNPN